MDSNVSNLDLGDRVKFALVVENTGGDDAFNVILQDNMPTGFQIPGAGLNLQVQTGDGNSRSYLGTDTDLFTSGIEVVDPSTLSGAIGSFTAATAAGDGSNLLIVTYDLELADSVTYNQTITNTGTLAGFGALDGGSNFRRRQYRALG